MATPARTDRVNAVVGAVRATIAGLAIATALLLLFRTSLVATFRASLLVLAALEILAFGRLALSGSSWSRAAIELVVKLLILTAAYIALSS